MIVLGLGNPGEQYRATRHNVGYRVVDRLAERWRLPLARAEATGRVARWAEGRFDGRRVVLAQPTTYMNRVGRAAAALLGRFEAVPAQLLVVYDDADLELGRLRVRKAGGAGGHNGMRSLIDRLRTTEFPRLRLGIRGTRRAAELADYVLDVFEEDEIEIVERMIETGAEAVETALRHDVESAMNRFNGQSAGTEDD